MPTISFVDLVISLHSHIRADGLLWNLVTAMCWLFGVLFGWAALSQLKEVADNQRHSYKAPITSFIAGALMISSPELLKSLVNTAYQTEAGVNPLSAVKDLGEGSPFRALMALVSFIGYVFFVRGIVILKESGEPQKYGQSTVGKAITVLFSAMAAIYIDTTLKILANTFHFDVSNYLN